MPALIAAPKRLVVLDGADRYPVETPGPHQLLDAIGTAGPRREG